VLFTKSVIFQENARRRALGLPIEGEENRELDDPNLETAKKKEDEDDEKSETSEGQQVAWRYSSYMEGLNKENIVNKTSEETFSCLSGEGKETGKFNTFFIGSITYKIFI